MIDNSDIKLTEYSHSSGCGCKIAPDKLHEILREKLSPNFPKLLVGNAASDDAAVFQINKEEALVSTTDFFMPIVNDPYVFGKIAATNALSDVYAMGGKPVLALAILGWPVDKLATKYAAAVMQGAIDVCTKANIPLAGGHSIDAHEPFFGLAVNGLVKPAHLKKNNTAQVGDLLYLTKPLGVGMAATAIKRNIATPALVQKAVEIMTQLNDIGSQLGKIPNVNALTDVTGFGLLGHLIEMMKASNASAQLWFQKVPTLPESMLQPLRDGFVFPDATYKNFGSYKNEVNTLNAKQLTLLCDPQTSGGLLISVNPNYKAEIEELLMRNNLPHQAIGQVVAPLKYTVEVE